MDGLTLALRALTGVAVLLPYAFCCVWPLRHYLKEKPPLYHAGIGLFFLIALCAFVLLFGNEAWILLAVAVTILLCTPVLRFCSGAPMAYILYCALLGLNGSAALALTVLDRSAGLMDTAPMLLFGLPVSALMTLAGAWMLKKYVLPYKEQIIADGRKTLDASTPVYFCVMLLIYFCDVDAAGHWIRYAVFALCLLGTWASYRRKAELLRTASANAGYLRRNGMLEHSLQLQQAQYSALTAQVAQARAARHDLRHHQRVMEQFIRDGDKQRLAQYLTAFNERVDACREDAAVCAHPAVDALARYYLEQAQQCGTKLDIMLDIREDIAIPAFDLCIVVGNLMENALEAIRECAPEKRFLRMRAEQSGQMLTLVAGNSFVGERLQKGEEFLSTKRNGEPGIGLSSIRSVALKYGGSVKTQVEDDLFRISVILFGEEA